MKRFIGILCILTMLMAGFYGLRPVRGEAEPVDGQADGAGNDAETGDADDGETDTDDTDVKDGSERDVSSKEEIANFPFILEAPKYAFLDRLSNDPKKQAVNAAFSINDSMAGFLSLSVDNRLSLLNAEGLADMAVTAQIDWAIDDPKDWHYNQFWSTEGKDEDGNDTLGAWAYIGIELEGEKVQSVKVFEDFGDPEDKENIAWKGQGHKTGWKDVLPEEILKKDEEEGFYYVDWTEHTLYIRVRYQVITFDNDEEHLKKTYFTAWSPVASFGKDVEEYYPYLLAADLPVPEISDLEAHPGVDGSEAQLTFRVNIDEKFEENALRTEVYGGIAHLVYNIRTDKDGEWKMVYGDVGSKTVTLPFSEFMPEGETYKEDMYLEVRAFTYIDQYLGIGGVWCGSLSGEFSDSRILGEKEPDITPEPTGEVTPTPDEGLTPTPTPTKAADIQPTIEAVHEPETKQEKDVCKLCHMEFDPQFFGVCIFIWLAAVVVVIIIITIIVKIVQKKQDEKTDILFR
ncbi:MAG: hypothetical protein K6F11_05185 [Lachnospiraceae bacterium]|nr:hypothetical protein [Lachnospiraceae bacterium]